MQIDFIKVPYTTGPNMIKNTGPVFVSPPDPEILKQKKSEIERYGRDLHGQVQGLERVIEKAALYCNVYSDQVIDLALRLEEDVAVMHQGRLAAISFCFPSGFIPASRLGMFLADIHAPVADSGMLVKSSPGIAKVMCEQASFVRHVWTVTANPDLSNHPDNQKDTIPRSLSDLYFRYEHQTTAMIDGETSLFFVRVNVLPLSEVINDRILDSINSMTDAVLTYKNLHQIKALLNSQRR
jgi:hypothetical protein